MTRPAPLHVLLAAALVLPSCGGGSGGGTTGGTPPPTGNPSDNPCTAALAAEPEVVRAGAAGKRGALGNDKRDPRDGIWAHRIASLKRATTLDDGRERDEDVGDIAVLQDDGSLVIPANPFDLASRGLRFTPNAAGGYDVASVDATLRSPLGDRLTLGDDDATAALAIPFAFPFYGQARSSVFVNSDGNVTFGESDTASTERSLSRVLTGPPRVAAFFADLDPTAGGRVFAGAAGGAFSVTWCSVRGFDSPSTVTTQLSLLPDGAVEVRFATASLDAAITALSPGATGVFTPVDLRNPPAAGGPSAVGERFAANAELDLVSASRRFLASHADDYDQIAFWTDQRVVEQGTFAFQTTIHNDIQGIGDDVYNFSDQFGSGGELEGLMVMDDLRKYPEDPNTRTVGEDTALALVAHETGHRWGVGTLFRDGGQDSDLLLGRQSAHWSFFFDSDASVLEGNEIEDLGGGSFRTATPSLRYGPLDLYNMGLIGPNEVPTVFFVDNPTGTSSTRESSPRSNVSFRGTRRAVTIDQIIQALGNRVPDVNRSPREHRQAFVYVVGVGRTADPAALAKLERMRAAWEPYFATATGGRMTVDTSLR